MAIMSELLIIERNPGKVRHHEIEKPVPVATFETYSKHDTPIYIVLHLGIPNNHIF
jgi:hypothetical protein